MRWAKLEGRRVAILGFGREGQATLRQWRRQFPTARIGIFEEHQSLDLPDANCELHTGPIDSAILSQYEVLLRSPGISPYRRSIDEARRRGVEVVSPGSLWFGAHPEAKTICITGTKGKSTTAALTAHLLRHCGQKVVLAGNIGRPLLDCDEQGVDWWVIEQSSYQLADLQAQPSIAAIVNISDEHLDWHGGRDRYHKDKLRLIELVGEGALVLNWQDRLLKQTAAHNVHWFGHPQTWHVHEDALWHGQSRAVGSDQICLNGEHNLNNLAAALTLVECAGLHVEDPVAGLAGFEILPHRLQLLGQRDGVRYVSDSLSTTPVATLAALQAYRDSRVILLAGGLERGLEWSDAAAQIAEYSPRAIICLPDNGPKIAVAIRLEGFEPELGIHCAASLQDAMHLVKQQAKAGDVVLLSPGAPSFPHFRDFADRGEQFARLAGLVQQG